MSNKDEWYTLPKYIEAARDVMHGIELDPASSEIANKTVKATRYYTREQNGLLQEWKAESVWLNPPYSRTPTQQGKHQSTIRMFTEKLLAHYEQGDVKQAIILATTEVNAKWFYPLWNYPVCIPNHRVHFMVQEQKDKYCQMFGTSFVYLGYDIERFMDVFSQFGHIVTCARQVKRSYIEIPLWTQKDGAA